MNTKRVLLLATSRNTNIKCEYKTANCLIIREFVGRGGVFVAQDATTASEVQFTLPKYVAKKLFITPNSEISTRKDSKNPETEW